MKHVGGIMILPEAVMDPVQANLHALKVVPGLVLQQMPHYLEMLPAHRIDFVAQPIFAIGAESLHVYRIISHQLVDGVPNTGRMRILILLRVGSQEAANRNPVDLARRKRGRHADDDGPSTLARNLIPNRQFLNRLGVDKAQTRIGVIGAVAKAVDAERARILAGGHTHPRRHRNGRDDALHSAPAAHLHQPPEIGQTLVAKQQRRCGAIQSQHENLHGNSDFPSITTSAGRPNAARIVGAKSTSAGPSCLRARLQNSTPGTNAGSMM